MYGLGDCLKAEFGWALNTLQHPASVHIAFTLPSAENVDVLIEDTKLAIQYCLDPEKYGKPDYNSKGTAAVYGMTSSIPKAVAGEVTKLYLDACYTAYE